VPKWRVEDSLAMMDRHGIATQMLSISSPSVYPFEAGKAVRLARAVNEEGAGYAKAHPARFGLFATVPLDDAAAAVDAVAAAVELVDDRHADYANLHAASLIADNSWNAGIVVGPWTTRWPELTEVEGTVSRDGAVIDRGVGHDVLGHPFEPLRWLAAHLLAQGDRLRAGEIVLTGSLTKTLFPDAPAAYRFLVGGIGAVDLTVR